MLEAANDVVITGTGVCTNMGDDLTEIEGRLREGRSIPFETYGPAVELECRCQLIGLYHGDVTNKSLGIPKAEGRFHGRAARLALKATQVALAQSGLDPSASAVVVGSGAGDVDTHVTINVALEKYNKARRIMPTVIPKLMASTVSANLVNVLRTTGPSFSASAACAGGVYNLLLAAQLIQTGHATSAIAGGVEVADIHFYTGFDSMRAYNGDDNERPERASRPYAADRAGFIFSEGAGIVILETRESAVARGAEILGVIRGFGMSSDGDGQMVAPSPEGAYRALEACVKNAGIDRDEIDYINTHGTSTPLGDTSEVRAIRKFFGDRALAYSSTKGYTGHTITAAGAMEAIFTLSMLRGGWIAPSVHADPLDPELEAYAPIVAPTDRALRYAVSNSFGFGGTNVAMALSAG
jgi:3-oxoacyl-[acyl-carrier-protein] synthase-1